MKRFAMKRLWLGGLVLITPLVWSAPLPYGALDEAKPSQPVVKKEKPVAARAPVAAPAPAIAAKPKVGQELKDCDICPVLVVLPKGEFLMGSPKSEPERDFDEGPQHRVKIDYGLAVGKFEVTQREWVAVMGSNPSRFKGEYLPVEQVSWKDVQTYIGKLNAQTENRYEYRLLSEAEWEYAARAATTTPFSTGQIISTEQANFDGRETYNGSQKGESQKKTTKVGSFSPNAWGLYDMHGNVWEWVEDCKHGNYVGAKGDGSAWVLNCKNFERGLRGGSWYDSPRASRSAMRNSNSSSIRYFGYGFRVARTL